MAKSTIPFHQRAAGSAQEIAEYLGVCKPMIQRAINSGALPSFKMGTRRIIRREAADQFAKTLENKHSQALEA